MLMQSHGDVIRLLPALPDTWPNGKVTDFREKVTPLLHPLLMACRAYSTSWPPFPNPAEDSPLFQPRFD
jgi:hypothetical protein